MKSLLPIVYLLAGLLTCHAVTNYPTDLTLTGIVRNFCIRFRPDLLTNGITLHTRTKLSAPADSQLYELETTFGSARKASFSVNGVAGEVIHFSAFIGFSAKQSTVTNVRTDAELARAAENIARQAAPSNATLQAVHSKQVKLSSQSDRAVADFVWQRSERGFTWKHDYIRVMLDAQDGELLALHKEWGSAPATTESRISRAGAEKKAIDAISARVKSSVSLRVQHAGLLIVAPNRAFGAVTPIPGIRRLAWSVEVSRVDAKGNQWEIWLDADTGEIIGGETLL